MTSEREDAGEKSIQEYSQSPHVDLATVVFMLSNQLRSHVTWRSAEDLEFLGVGAESSKTEVNDLDHISLFFDQNVVKFDVSVRNTFVMKVIKSFYDLFEEPAADRFFHLSVCALLLDVLVQRDAWDVVCYDADGLACFYQIVHLDDVRVIDLLQRHDFPLHGLSLHRVVQFGLLVDLDGVLLHVYFVVANVNNGVRTLTNCFTNLVLVDAVLLLTLSR